VIHPTSDVSPKAQIGEGTIIWHQAQVREGSIIGRDCIIGKGVYIDFDVRIGDRCKLQNGVNVYHGVSLGDGVLLGPGAICLNDKYPRAINADGSLKTDDDWTVSSYHIGDGAGIGGGAIILPGVNIGRWAIVGSGAVVTRDVPDHGLVYGNPAQLHGFVCKCGQPLGEPDVRDEAVYFVCIHCGEEVNLPLSTYEKLTEV
jgi:acetyltransferase-like isoleucine patch superfamily enzyme